MKEKIVDYVQIYPIKWVVTKITGKYGKKNNELSLPGWGACGHCVYGITHKWLYANFW